MHITIIPSLRELHCSGYIVRNCTSAVNEASSNLRDVFTAFFLNFVLSRSQTIATSFKSLPQTIAASLNIYYAGCETISTEEEKILSAY